MLYARQKQIHLPCVDSSPMILYDFRQWAHHAAGFFSLFLLRKGERRENGRETATRIKSLRRTLISNDLGRKKSRNEDFSCERLENFEVPNNFHRKRFYIHHVDTNQTA